MRLDSAGWSLAPQIYCYLRANMARSGTENGCGAPWAPVDGNQARWNYKERQLKASPSISGDEDNIGDICRRKSAPSLNRPSDIGLDVSTHIGDELRWARQLTAPVQRPRTSSIRAVQASVIRRIGSIAGGYLDKSLALERLDSPELALDLARTSLELADVDVSRVNLVLYCSFGMSGWWAAQALYAELPLLVDTLPEKQRLGNLMCFTCQVGNVVPIVYKLAQRRYNFRVDRVIKLLQVSAVVTLSCLSFFWQCQWLGRSIPLLTMSILAGCVGCMTDVTFWAYALHHPPRATRAIGTGIPAGGFIATLLAVIQIGTSSTPRFSVGTFFLMSAALQAVWLLVMLKLEGILRSFWQWIRRACCSAGHKGLGIVRVGSASESLISATEGGKCSDLSMDDFDADGAGDEAPDVPMMAHVLGASCFCIYGATYALPSSFPYVARAYPTDSQQVLLWMLFFQSLGDLLGRICSPGSSTPGGNCFLALAVVSMPVTFLSMVGCASWPAVVAHHLSYNTAVVLLPALCFLFYFSAGMLVNALFLRARHLVEDQDLAAEVSSTIGFCGQMGAMTGNMLTFVALSVFEVLD